MIKYEFARVEGNDQAVCTNYGELEELYKSIEKELLPLNSKYKPRMTNDELKFTIEIPGAWSTSTNPVRWWLIKWFTERGWEPFSHFDTVYSFRRRVEE